MTLWSKFPLDVWILVLLESELSTILCCEMTCKALKNIISQAAEVSYRKETLLRGYSPLSSRQTFTARQLREALIRQDDSWITADFVPSIELEFPSTISIYDVEVLGHYAIMFHESTDLDDQALYQVHLPSATVSKHAIYPRGSEILCMINILAPRGVILYVGIGPSLAIGSPYPDWQFVVLSCHPLSSSTTTQSFYQEKVFIPISGILASEGETWSILGAFVSIVLPIQSLVPEDLSTSTQVVLYNWVNGKHVSLTFNVSTTDIDVDFLDDVIVIISDRSSSMLKVYELRDSSALDHRPVTIAHKADLALPFTLPTNSWMSYRSSPLETQPLDSFPEDGNAPELPLHDRNEIYGCLFVLFMKLPGASPFAAAAEAEPETEGMFLSALLVLRRSAFRRWVHMQSWMSVGHTSPPAPPESQVPGVGSPPVCTPLNIIPWSEWGAPLAAVIPLGPLYASQIIVEGPRILCMNHFGAGAMSSAPPEDAMYDFGCWLESPNGDLRPPHFLSTSTPSSTWRTYISPESTAIEIEEEQHISYTSAAAANVQGGGESVEAEAGHRCVSWDKIFEEFPSLKEGAMRGRWMYRVQRGNLFSPIYRSISLGVQRPAVYFSPDCGRLLVIEDHEDEPDTPPHRLLILRPNVAQPRVGGPSASAESSPQGFVRLSLSAADLGET